MHRLFGLFRDPFAGAADGDLYWESGERAAVRRRTLEVLRDGQDVWLRGPAGSGRQAFLARTAGDLALEGRRILWSEQDELNSAEAFLSLLLSVADPTATRTDLLPTAERFYAKLLEAFAETGITTVFAGSPALGAGALEEAEMFASLRVAGFRLVNLALIGEGPPPWAGLREVLLPPLSSEELKACILHRAAACGRETALPRKILDTLAEGASGIGDAMERARTALFSRAFRDFPRAAEPSGVGDRTSPLLDPRELDEVGCLLETLGHRGAGSEAKA